jgi:hypothetical protein
LDGVCVQGDGADLGGGFGRPFRDLVAGGGAVAHDEQHAAIEVDLGPAQPACLTTAQSAHADA